MAKGIKRFRGPCDSGPHRIACKALYRALLELCPQVPLPGDLPSQGAVNPIKHLIRKGFRRYQYNYSANLSVKALKVGYNAEELLRAAASGSQPATSQIHNILHGLHVQRQESQQPRAPRRERPRVWPYPGAPKVLDIRPLPLEKLSGRRHVPIFTHATGMPFLRFKKPQSPFLSRVLRGKLVQRHKLFESIKHIDEEAGTVANWEDQWDSYVLQQLEKERGDTEAWAEKEKLGGLDGYRKEVKNATSDVWDRLNKGLEKGKEISERMIEIVEREKALQQEERSARRHAKKVEKNRKKAEDAKRIDTPEEGGID